MNDHERFKKHLMDSQKCVWKASKSLSDIGLPVTIEPTFYSVATIVVRLHHQAY